MRAAPQIREVGLLWIAGVSFTGNPFLSAGGAGLSNLELLYRRHERTLAAVKGLGDLVQDAEARYELHVYGEESAASGTVEVFVGQRVAEGSAVPHEMCLKILPPSLYAVVELAGDQTASDWRGWISREWLPGSPYEEAGSYDLQRRSAADGRQGDLEGWVPVRRRG